MTTTTTVHACPRGAEPHTPCCSRSPFELFGDRITLVDALVTCGRPDNLRHKVALVIQSQFTNGGDVQTEDFYEEADEILQVPEIVTALTALDTLARVRQAFYAEDEA